MSTHEQLAVLRRELNGLVAAWNHRTGQPHGVTHAALRKECGGPAAAVATADQLRDPDRPDPGLGGRAGAPEYPRRMAAETSQTLDRGLRVLDVLAHSPSGLSVTELAAAVGVNRTVVYRLVATLEQHGLARRDTAGQAARRARRARAGARPAAGAARAGRPGAAHAGRGARLHRAPDDRRRRRGARDRGGGAELDRLPRRLPGRRPPPARAGGRRAGRSCSAGRSPPGRPGEERSVQTGRRAAAGRPRAGRAGARRGRASRRRSASSPSGDLDVAGRSRVEPPPRRSPRPPDQDAHRPAEPVLTVRSPGSRGV